MKIQKIVPFKYKKQYRTLQFEGGYTLKLHEELIAARHLMEGCTLEDETLSQLILEEEKKEAFEHALLLLNLRDHSENEMEERLKRKGFSKNVVQWLLGDLKSKKLVDDSRFAKNFTEISLKKKRLGQEKIEEDLARKGIQPQIIQDTLDTLLKDVSDPVLDEEERAYQSLLKRLKQIKGVDPRAVYRRLYDHLSRRGYSSDTIEKTLSRYSRECKETGKEALDVTE
ncbi:MAG: regulatory protein RecX [Elusimicrobia bacterium]|nr:regulatory protein RecX [Elusimicrobiota bacterium]MBI3012817.1 regulatory protein RecX [Elusimicrobiota bacterium]